MNNEKYYKALLKEPYMTSKYGNMKYELGKEYNIEGNLELCHNGYHFCDAIENVFNYYSNSNIMIFEVEPIGNILKRNNKYCSEGIKLIREIPKEEITDIAFISLNKSDENRTFLKKPKVIFEFENVHTSAGITLFFGKNYPGKIKVIWIDSYDNELKKNVYTPNDTKFVIIEQVTNYKKVSIEFSNSGIFIPKVGCFVWQTCLLV